MRKKVHELLDMCDRVTGGRTDDHSAHMDFGYGSSEIEPFIKSSFRSLEVPSSSVADDSFGPGEEGKTSDSDLRLDYSPSPALPRRHPANDIRSDSPLLTVSRHSPDPFNRNSLHPAIPTQQSIVRGRNGFSPIGVHFNENADLSRAPRAADEPKILEREQSRINGSATLDEHPQSVSTGERERNKHTRLDSEAADDGEDEQMRTDEDDENERLWEAQAIEAADIAEAGEDTGEPHNTKCSSPPSSHPLIALQGHTRKRRSRQHRCFVSVRCRMVIRLFAGRTASSIRA